MKKLLIALVTLVLVATAATAVWLMTRSDDEPVADLEPTGEAVDESLREFYEQTVAWDKCGNALCGELKVPTNYDDPEAETTTLAIKRLPARGDDATKVLFLNPGGPGGSAMDFVTQFADATSAEMLETFDIVGMDPRGVGLSSPLECLTDEEFDDFLMVDGTPDSDEEIDEMIAATVAMGEACRENSGLLASHVSTAEVARDHDIARAVLGQEKMHWFGASYGTQLGATYADLFPENVGTMVLDGAVDVTISEEDMSYGQAVGFERALTAYIADCIDQGCPLGSTDAEVRATFNDVIEQADTDPLAGADGRILSEGWLFYGLILPLYNEGNWPVLTVGVESAAQGDPSMMFRLADFYFNRNAEGEYGDNGGQVIYAVNCLDSGSREPMDVDRLRNEIVPRFTQASEVFGPVMAWGVYGCDSWPIEPANPQQPVTAEGAPPILVLGTTRDSATPYEWAQAMAEQLTSGVLVTRDGDGHTAYITGNSCIQGIVEDYFLNGAVPEEGIVCE